MSRLFKLILILILAGTLPLLAQEEEGEMHMAPPPPLEDDFMKWMVGEWEGHSKSEMGKSKDHMTCEMGFGGQFMLTNYKSEREDSTVMTGMGAITQTKDGKLAGYWIDSWRTMSEGKGSQEGNIFTMEWITPMGTYVRKTEMVDENTMKITGLMKSADGKEMHSESELKRIKD